jgi:NUBPL iron-transfer P-loop NTPase
MAPVHSRLSAIIVTTPQAVALMDVMKCLSFARAVNLPIIGLIENMSGYVCPCCGEISNVFSTGGGVEMARRENLTFLGSLPVDTELVSLLDAGETEIPAEGASKKDAWSFRLLQKYKLTPSARLFESILGVVLQHLGEQV